MIENKNEVSDTTFLSPESVEQQHETCWVASERLKFIMLARNTL